MCTRHRPTEGADSAPTPAEHGHAYPDDPIRRNLDAVRTGAAVHDTGSDAELLRQGMIRVNGAGWYDLTPLGRATLDGTIAERREVSISADGMDG